MQRGVTPANLKDHAATVYDIPEHKRLGKVALVLGAGNIAAISPLVTFQKLFLEHQVVQLKMNPVNDYLTEYIEAALKPLIDRNVLRIHRGDSAAGAYLCEHPQVEEIHITGAGATHDAIVWGTGAEGAGNKRAGTPKNTRHITSELGAVCPTIVVPGPWSSADLRFQAENIATMKLYNSGFNCVAVQSLILPEGWSKTDDLLKALGDVMAKFGQREAYYPGAGARQSECDSHTDGAMALDRGAGVPPCSVADMERGDVAWLARNEVFAPALGIKHIAAPDPETYLREAI